MSFNDILSIADVTKRQMRREVDGRGLFKV